ncbi:MAG: dTDP-4-dehydrorhamnose 3,5-epimerase [Bacteroides sp. SM23_62_1]|nr:MAG: dTDP-4-dehydrorhamnose 3,5-epimerase [Bacteroides sp. SM23_62_1]
MRVTEAPLPGILIIEPHIHSDSRGYFFESYNLNKLKSYGVTMQFVQDNQSKSGFGVVRGLHYQLQPYAQVKLVRVLQGTIYDFAVDIRKNSSTFGKYFGLELSDENNKQLLIPVGFAHGFAVLSESAIVFYKCDKFYNPSAERGIRYNDPDLNIDWKLKQEDIEVSERDSVLPLFRDAEMNF